MRIEFFLPMKNPPTVTAQEQGIRVVNGKPVVYDTEEIKAARSILTAYLAKHRPDRRLEGPIRLTVKWLFHRGEKHRDGEYRITRPDTDNLQKLLKDCMTRCGFWRDDALVASEITEKFWAELPGIYIRAEELWHSPEQKQESFWPEEEELCGTCDWHDNYSCVCCNGGSDFGGDVTELDSSCPEWERRQKNGGL